MNVRVVSLVVTISVFGCRDGSITPADVISRDSSQIEALKAEVALLKSRLDAAEWLTRSERIAYLTPGERGYQRVRFELGTITVSLEDVKSYANGSKVTLRFGNPLAAELTQVKARLEWGTVGANGYPDEKIRKSKDVSFTESLRAGSWTGTDVVLDGVQPAELGFVRVLELSCGGMTLKR
jgi:hypothetical protein